MKNTLKLMFHYFIVHLHFLYVLFLQAHTGASPYYERTNL